MGDSLGGQVQPSKNEPLVSVIMNCYNSEKYLREAIDSVLAQTYKNWEIIFWDNHSTDRSAEIFNSYNEPRMKYFLATGHTVLGQARNLAIEHAKGDWLGFLDCDDLWLQTKLEKQVAIINDNGHELGLVYSEAEHFVEEEGKSTVLGRRLAKLSSKKINPNYSSGHIFPDMLKGNLIPLVSAIVRRSAFVNVGGISADMKQAEDYELFVKITKSYKAIAVNDVTCLYRIHQNNITHNQSEKSYTESISVVQRYLPQPEAIDGLRIWQANYAGYLFMNGRYKDGLINLVSSRSFLFFIKKSLKKVILG